MIIDLSYYYITFFSRNIWINLEGLTHDLFFALLQISKFGSHLLYPKVATKVCPYRKEDQ